MQRRMFRSELQQVIGTSDEFVIIFGMIVLYLLYRNQHDPIVSSRVGMVIIGIILVSVFKNMSVIVYMGVTGTYKDIRDWIHRKTGHRKKKRARIRLEKADRIEKQRAREEEDEILRLGRVPTPPRETQVPESSKAIIVKPKRKYIKKSSSLDSSKSKKRKKLNIESDLKAEDLMPISSQESVSDIDSPTKPKKLPKK